jgi:hypothetical protein
METIEKIDVRAMKADIKKMVEEQRFYKKQRKDAKYIIKDGEKFGHWDPMHPSEAQWKHAAMRKKLRLIYAAYGKARGKSFSQVENKYPEENHPLNQWCVSIDSLVNRYRIMVPVETIEQ